MSEITFTVPGIPPNLNHYVRHTRTGKHYRTAAADRFKRDLAICLANRSVFGKNFEVEVVIHLGPKQKGDVDGFGKLVLDGLAEAGAFRAYAKDTFRLLSDSWVNDLILRKRRAEKSETVITVRAR